MNTIFCPILKTKRVSERNALQALMPLLEKNVSVIPYLQLLKDDDQNRTDKYISVLSDLPFFVEPVSNISLLDLLTYPQSIPVFNIKNSAPDVDLYNYISKCHEFNRRVAVKISCYDSKNASYLLSQLNSHDYLFIDIDKNDYSSVALLMILKGIPRQCKIIINSNERNVAYSGKDFNKYNDSFPRVTLFNTSIIKSIKNGTFAFDGFGSYCAAKNDSTEEIQIANTIFGYLLTYNYEQNDFYIVTTDTPDHISRVYNTLVQEIYSSRRTVLTYLATTPISNSMLEAAYSIGKLSCSRKITIEITHYIEEMINNLK